MAVENVVKYLENAKYTNVRPLDKGAYGDVLSALCPQKEEVAIKIINKASSWVVEDEIWPVLNHAHILPVLEVIQLEYLELKLFISPKLPTSLFRIVQTEEFRTDPGALDRVRKWMKHVLAGLDYLHNSGFAHMDIKTDNVLISSEDSAVVCDFSGLAITELKVTRFCSPIKFLPPECWKSNGVDGVRFDMWTYGLMALNVVAGHWPTMQIITYCEGWTWEKNVKPVLEKALDENNLEYFMKQSMPHAPIENEDVKCTLSFLIQILKLNPSERPTARQAAAHPFLRSSGLETDSTTVQVHTNAPAITAILPPIPVPKTFVVRESQKTELVMACGDDPTPVPTVENGACNPPPTRARRGLVKRLGSWLVRKVRGVARKRRGYENNLEYFMKQSMPHAPIENEDVKCTLAFLIQMLKLNPSERPTARQAAAHPFLRISVKETNSSTVKVHTNVPAIRVILPPIPVAKTFVVRESQKTVRVMTCRDDPTPAPTVENGTCIPPPTRARRGLIKRLGSWLVRKVRGVGRKRRGYVPLKNSLSD